MIKSFKHKGLEKSFTRGSTAGIQHQHKSRLEERLQAVVLLRLALQIHSAQCGSVCVPCCQGY